MLSEDYSWKHEIGNKECPVCWRGFPQLCKCGGLIHAEFEDEDWDNIYLTKSCDKCDNWEYAEDEDD